MIIEEKTARGDKWEITQFEERYVSIYKNGQLKRKITVTKENLGAEQLEAILHLYQLEDE